MEQFEFNCFLLQISKKLTPTDFKQLKYVLHGYVPSSQHEEFNEAFLYFEELQKAGVLTPLNFGVLKQAFDVIGRPDLVELLEQKEQHCADVFRKHVKDGDNLEQKANQEDPTLDHKEAKPNTKEVEPVVPSESRNLPQEQEDEVTEVVPYGRLIDVDLYEDLDVLGPETTNIKEPAEDGLSVPASPTGVENSEDKEMTEPVEENPSSSPPDYGRTGDVYFHRGDFKQAIACFQQYLSVAEEKGDKAVEAHAYGKLGDAYEGLHDSSEAIECHMKRLTIAKELGDRVEEGAAYSSIGNAYESCSDFRQAIEYHIKHLAIAKEEGDRAEEGTSYGNLGDAYERLGEFEQAMEYRVLHLAIAKEVGDGEGAAYCRLGKAYHNFGDFTQAIEYHNRHLTIAKERGNKIEEGIAYCNLGMAYHRLGDFTKAIEFHEKDLSIAKEVGDRAGVGTSYGNLGNSYHSIGNYEQATKYHQLHLTIAKEVGRRADEGAAYCNLGRAYQALGSFEKAIEYLQQDFTISKELGDRAGEGTSYGNLGSAYEKLGDFKKGIEFHNRSLTIAKEVGDKAGQGLAYGNLGKAHYGLGNFVTAIECHNQHLSIAKEVGDKALEADAFYSLGRISQNMGSLNEALVYFRSSVAIYDSMKALLGSRDSWKINFRDLYEKAYSSLWKTLLELQKSEEALFVAEQGRAQALVDLMKEKYDNGFHATAPCETLCDFVNDVSSQIVFLALENDKINFWVLGMGNQIQFRQKSVEVEDLVTFMHSTHRVNYPGVATSLLHSLYDAVISPVSDLLHGDELIIVPDGPLWLAPYAAFVDHDSRYLGETFRIRLIPSLTCLKLISDSPEDYHCKSGVLLVGDPFTKRRGRRVGELPNAKKEVEIIGAIFHSKPLTGKDATKEVVLERMGSAALIHIAGHSYGGKIGLAVSEFSKERDSFLTEEDVKGIKLRARLVVLSCSETGLGDIKAEGVVGLARAFLGAGARSVVVSIWDIEDVATMRFMECFYQHLADGHSASVALHHAQKCLRESEDFAAERCWAPFVLTGDDVTIELERREEALSGKAMWR